MPPPRKKPSRRPASAAAKGVRCGWFRDETYSVNIHLLWAAGRQPLTNAHVSEYARRVFRCDIPDDHARYHGCWLEIEQPLENVHLIALYDPWLGSAGCHGTLAHEVWHAADHILASRGIPHLPGEANEAHAYFIDSLTRRCLALIMGG